ncbi:MAG: hypothetical protein U9Q62_06595 [Campylobacterota bacterium]|nr:hypothetical protein [Campylobacterota bacterium]
MTQEILMDKYPVVTIELLKNEIGQGNVDEILEYLSDCIEKDPIATFIGLFDHYSHTKQLEGGEIAPEILDAKNIIFCFGQKLPNPKILAVRPRSIGVAEKADSFVISLMEAPNEPMHRKMEEWVKALKQ